MRLGLGSTHRTNPTLTASPVKEDIIDVEDNIEGVEPDFGEFEAAPKENFKELEELGSQDVEMEQENVKEAQPETAL